jgi:hypothetical protein
MQLHISGLGGRGRGFLGLGAASAQVTQKIASSQLDPKIYANWTPIPTNDPGYSKTHGAYFWGYRPPMICHNLNGVRGLGAAGDPSCPNGYTDQPPFSVIVAPPVATSCPTPAPCPPCARTPTVVTTAPIVATAPDTHGKYGMNLGLLLAGGLVAGGGYYGYKKGWFKKLFKKHR